MSNTIYPLTQRLTQIQNTHDFPIHIPEEIRSEPKALEAFLEEGYKHFQSPEVLTRGKQIPSSDHYRNIFMASQHIPNNGNHNVTQENFEPLVIDENKSRARGKDWANANISLGMQAASAALSSVFLGIGKAIIENLGFVPTLLKKALNVFYGFKLGQRGKKQFTLHERPDDEGGMNIYQGLMYGNIASAKSAELACKVETKFNNWLLPSIGLLEIEKRNALFYLLMVPKLLWWRARYMAYIDQRFATSSLKYLIHKPLAIWGRERSQETVDEIDKSKVLTIDYIKKRIKENLRVEEGESVVSKVTTSFKDIFSKDIDKQDEATTCLNQGMGAITGTLGVIACGVFIPLKAGLDLAKVELNEPLNKALNFSSTFGFFTQQSHYIPRFSIPEFIKSKQITVKLKDKSKSEWVIKHKKEFEELRSERFKLFFTGLGANFLGIIFPFTKLLNNDNLFVKIFKSIVSELSNNSLLYFLSKRRVLEGKAKLLEIKELDAKDEEKEEKEKNGVYDIWIQN